MQFPQPFRAAPVTDEVEEPAPKRRKPTEPPCDTPEGQQFYSKDGRFKWASCESIVFDWAVKDPQEFDAMRTQDANNELRSMCKNREEPLGCIHKYVERRGVGGGWRRYWMYIGVLALVTSVRS